MTTDRLTSNDRNNRWIRWSVPAAAIIIVAGFAVLVPRGVSAPTVPPPKQTTAVPTPQAPAPTPASTPSAPAETSAGSKTAPIATSTPASPASGAPTPNPGANPGNDKPRELAPGILVPPGRTVTYIRGQGPPPTDKPGVSTSLRPAPLDQIEKQREQIFRETHGGAAPPKPTDPPKPRDPNSTEITSADPSIAWRIRGDVERSLDAGQSWTAVPTGRRGVLAAGDAPSRFLCWVVGHSGLVLRMTDGKTWETLTFPEKTDLKTIAAFDARYAIVTTADGREFRTNDGGVTWRR